MTLLFFGPAVNDGDAVIHSAHLLREQYLSKKMYKKRHAWGLKMSRQGSFLGRGGGGGGGGFSWSPSVLFRAAT